MRHPDGRALSSRYPGLFTQVILSKAKDLPCLRLGQILRYAQNDRNALFMNNPGYNRFPEM